MIYTLVGFLIASLMKIDWISFDNGKLYNNIFEIIERPPPPSFPTDNKEEEIIQEDEEEEVENNSI